MLSSSWREWKVPWLSDIDASGATVGLFRKTLYIARQRVVAINGRKESKRIPEAEGLQGRHMLYCCIRSCRHSVIACQAL